MPLKDESLTSSEDEIESPKLLILPDIKQSSMKDRLKTTLTVSTDKKSTPDKDNDPRQANFGGIVEKVS